jgi:hypothetical protein
MEEIGTEVVRVDLMGGQMEDFDAQQRADRLKNEKNH